MAEWGDWVAECQAYAEAALVNVDSGLATILGKYSTGVAGIGEVDRAKKKFEEVDADDGQAKTAAAREVIDLTNAVSKEFLESI